MTDDEFVWLMDMASMTTVFVDGVPQRRPAFVCTGYMSDDDVQRAERALADLHGITLADEEARRA